MPTPKLFAQDGNEYREFTDAEYEQHATDLIKYKKQDEINTAKVKARETLLNRLGMTADEAELLIG